jgi:glycosyltransferase involved in cell wall biosynthesis
MNITLVVPTHNRLHYTIKTLNRLLEDPKEEFELYLWDNASTDETPEYLKEIKDPRIREVILSKKNVGQTGAMNYCWGKSKAELVGKLDNDCLVTPGWTRILAEAHRDIERLGAIACWHFRKDDFDEQVARKAGKIQYFNGHFILRHPWVCGSGFIMKRSTYIKYGVWESGPNVGTTSYFLRMALGGEINGWYYPFIFQEHMDDPKSECTVIRRDEDIHKWYHVTYTLRVNNIRNMKSRLERRKLVLENLNYGPWEAKWYVGWRKYWLNFVKYGKRILSCLKTE